MLAVKGYYDGVTFQPLENVTFPKNQKVIILALDNIEEEPNEDTLEAMAEVAQMKKNPAENQGWHDVDLMMEELLK